MELRTRFFYIGLIIFFFAGYACQNENTSIVSNDEIIKVYVQEEGVNEGSIAYLHIEGMSCAQACGSSIKNSVSGVAGVSNSEIEFDSEKTIDVCKVTYDADKTNEDELISAVQDLYDGRYQVKKVEVVSFVEGDDTDGVETDQDIDYDASVELREFSLPNLSDIIENLIQ